jgi:hypothetical protein
MQVQGSPALCADRQAALLQQPYCSQTEILQAGWFQYALSHASRWWEILLLGCNSGRMATRALKDHVCFMLLWRKNCWPYKLPDTLTVLGVVTHSRWDPPVTRGLRLADVLQLQSRRSR